MIADPLQAGAELLDAWASDLRHHVLTDALVAFVARTGDARAWMGRWIDSDDE
jgi:hypothetical protein